MPLCYQSAYWSRCACSPLLSVSHHNAAAGSVIWPLEPLSLLNITVRRSCWGPKRGSMRETKTWCFFLPSSLLKILMNMVYLCGARWLISLPLWCRLWSVRRVAMKLNTSIYCIYNYCIWNEPQWFWWFPNIDLQYKVPQISRLISFSPIRLGCSTYAVTVENIADNTDDDVNDRKPKQRHHVFWWRTYQEDVPRTMQVSHRH